MPIGDCQTIMKYTEKTIDLSQRESVDIEPLSDGYPKSIWNFSVEAPQENRNNTLRFYGGDLQRKTRITRTFEIPVGAEAEFDAFIDESVANFSKLLIMRGLPEAPLRDYRARENIIAYIRSPEGLRPWLNAGVLDRPMIKRLSPRAYVALSNWLRDPEHSLEREGLSIPTKWDVVAERQSDPDRVREAYRVVRSSYRGKTAGKIPSP